MQKFFILCFFLIIHSLLSEAQERCGTVQFMHQLEQRAIKQNKDQFEEWLQRKILERNQQLQAQRNQAAPYKIPVVVHIIHNGEPVGTGMNISDARVYSQIDVLNDDFKRLNTDASNTPLEFASVVGSLDIEFVLAKQAPDGSATDGIVRVNGGRTSWSPFDPDLNATSYWSSEDYLNIWVTNLGSSFLGYAQFPVANIPGLEEFQDGLAETDGVAIDYTVFGVGSPDPKYNLGRTTTHEVGHFLGLRHIWGDESTCSGTDYVNDTPNQEDQTLSCPSHPQFECTNNKMFQNYMDYTDDVCMNLFTQGQIDRMVTILETPSIPRRNSLLTSIGLDDPVVGTIDLAVQAVLDPGPVTCNETPVVRLAVENLSMETITSLKVRVTVNESSTETLLLDDLNLTGAGEISVQSSALLVGVNSVSVNVIQINGASDPAPGNNTLDFEVDLIYPECEPFAVYPGTNGEPVITFDLSKPSPVKISVLNAMGQSITSVTATDVRNQTITLPATLPTNTVYIIRLQIGNMFYSRKVYFRP